MITDTQLITACRQGDESAWEALVKRYQRLIYAIPKRAGLDEDQAADVFQEVFTTLYTKLDNIEDPERLHAWLVTTARRKTWKVIAKESSPRQFIDAEEDDDAQPFDIPDTAVLPDEALLKLEQQHRVRTAIASVEERCQKLIKMLFYEAEPPSYGEIAAALGISQGSIGPTRARCLEKVLRNLGKL